MPVESGALEAADGAEDSTLLGETATELDAAVVAKIPPEEAVLEGIESEGME